MPTNQRVEVCAASRSLWATDCDRNELLVVGLWALAKLFGSALLSFLLDAPSLRVSTWPCGSSRFLGDEGGAHAPGQSFFCDFAISELRAFVVDDHSHQGTEVVGEHLPLVISDDGRFDEVPREFNARRSLVRMLSARPTGRAELLGEFCVGDDE